jgi:hypothetical protein
MVIAKHEVWADWELPSRHNPGQFTLSRPVKIRAPWVISNSKESKTMRAKFRKSITGVPTLSCRNSRVTSSRPDAEGKGKVTSRELYTMPLPRENASVVRNIEGQEGQQVARVGDVLSAAVG